MSVTDSRYSTDELARLGDEIMTSRVQPTLHPGDVGKFVAIDVITGEFEIDEDDYTAVARLRLRKPNADMWLARAGFPTAIRIGIFQ